jgi:hypothetical protein
MGPRLVQHVDGSEEAKLRLEVILETIAGELAIKDACARLGIGEAMFHKLRNRVLEASVMELEAKPRGRPRLESTEQAARVEDLAREVDELREQLLAAEVRLELAATMPHILATEKKTTQQNELNRAWRARQRRRNRHPK